MLRPEFELRQFMSAKCSNINIFLRLPSNRNESFIYYFSTTIFSSVQIILFQLKQVYILKYHIKIICKIVADFLKTPKYMVHVRHFYL